MRGDPPLRKGICLMACLCYSRFMARVNVVVFANMAETT